MRRATVLLASLAIVFAVAPSAALATPTTTDTWIVTLADGRDPHADARSFVRAHGGEVKYVYEQALNGFAFRGSAQAAEAIRRNPNVTRVEADAEVWLDETQSNATWGIDRIDQRSGTDGTYTYDATGAGVTAYVIDSGILTGHSEFGGRASVGLDLVGTNDGQDCNGHGTHVAGTIGGATYGVAKAVSLVAVRVFDCTGGSSWSTIIAAIDWVVGDHNGPNDEGADEPAVANMSLGGGANSSVDQAVQSMIADGVATAVAAGNGNFAGREDDACKYSPARVPEAMTISATDKTDTKASWANYGNCVDWFAPGVSITSAWYTSSTATNTISGTSMATPHAAGVAALFLAENPSATPQVVRDAVYEATTKDVVNSSKTANDHLLYSGFITSSVDVTAPPTADAGGPYTGTEDSSVAFSSAGSSDPDGAGLTYSWNFGDGSTSSVAAPSHTYLWGGSFIATLTVTDGSGQSATDTATVSITEVNDQPIADAGGPYNGTVGTSVTFDASASSDFDNQDGTDLNDQVLSYAWDFGDGSPSASGARVTHAYTAVGLYNVSVSVSDAIASATAATTADVTDKSATMHVGDLDDAGSVNNGSTWTARVRATVLDGDQRPVPGATVRGTFAYATGTVSASCVTIADGTCILSGSAIPKKSSSTTFTVTDVTVSDNTLAYTASDNDDPEGDSNGTSITVLKP